MWGRTLRISGYTALGLGAVCGTAGGQHFRGSTPVLRSWPQAVVALVAMGVLLAGGRWAVRQGERHLATVLETLPRTGPVVLFLRAFIDDEDFARMPSGIPVTPWHSIAASEEMQITRAVAPFGTMVALGAPSDSTPWPGADRHYASDSAWQDQVLTALDQAALVLLACGAGPSLRWEVEQVVARDVPEQLVLVIVRDAARYESFRATMLDAFPRGLPDYEEVEPPTGVAARAFVRAVVWFDADWTPHLAQLYSDSHVGMLVRLDRWVETAFPLALRVVYERAGLALPGLPPGPRPRPRAVTAAIAAHAVTAAAGVLLLCLSASADSRLLWTLPMIALPGVLLYRVWRGGHFSVMAARGVGLLFGGMTTAVSLVSVHIIGLALGVGLLAGGLLLRREDVRDWTSALVLHGPDGHS